MTTALYNDMLLFAKRVLPYSSTLEPADLVSEAYLSVGISDLIVLKKKIKGLAIQEMSYTVKRTAFVEYNPKTSAKTKPLIETSKVCKSCHQEKDFSDFGFSGSNKQYLRNTCKQCENKKQWKAIKINPDKHNAIKERRKKSRELENFKNRERLLKLKSNPELYEEYKKQKRERQSEYNKARTKRIWEEIKNDPEKLAAKRQEARDRYRKKKEATKCINLVGWELVRYQIKAIHKRSKKVEVERRFYQNVKANPVKYSQRIKLANERFKSKYAEMKKDPVKWQEFQKKRAAYYQESKQKKLNQ